MSGRMDSSRGFPSGISRIRVLLALLLFASGAVFFVFWCGHAPVLDRFGFLSSRTANQNSAGFIGSQACGECHSQISESYSRHSMANSLTPANELKPPNSLPVRFVVDGAALCAVFQEGDRVVHSVAEPDSDGNEISELRFTAQVDFVIGSGTRGKSFLIETDQHLFQSPISWYHEKNGWDLSPGYSAWPRAGLFDRPITHECLFCHAGRINPREDTTNGYQKPIFVEASIGCERCHGPGELHRERHRKGTVDDYPDSTIVNPARLDPVLRDNVCEQCHLRGEIRVVRRGRNPTDYRPGMPLDDFLRTFVAQEDSIGSQQSTSVGHVEQMRQSRCFAASGGKMACISCHDPHYLPAVAERANYFRQRCLNCHRDLHVADCKNLGGTLSASDSTNDCVSCHMPKHKLRNIPHVAETDHRIAGGTGGSVPGDPESSIPRPRKLLVYPDRGTISDAEEFRDLGVAISKLWQLHKVQEYQQPALEISTAVVEKWPDDLESRLNLATLLKAGGKFQAAADQYQRVLESRPGHAFALAEQASLFLEMGQLDRAISAARRVAQMAPNASSKWAVLADIYARQERWPESMDASSRAVKLDPLNWPARRLLVQALVARRMTNQAHEQLKLFERANNSDAELVRKWVQSIAP